MGLLIHATQLRCKHASSPTTLRFISPPINNNGDMNFTHTYIHS